VSVRPLPFAATAAALALAALGLAGGAAAQARPYELKPGKWGKRHAPEDWVIHQSKHYQIQSQVGIEKAKRLADHMEAMLVVYTRMFKPDRSDFHEQPVKLFKDREAFLRYGAPPRAAAYYDRGNREMVCYDTGRWTDEEQPVTGRVDIRTLFEKSQMDLLGVMAHEGWHQYFHWYVVSMVQLPSWINEGLGDYFYCARPKQQKGRKIPAELGRLNETRLPIIRAVAKRDRHVPIKDILEYTQAEYYANPSVCYAEGWALCHFLEHSGDQRYENVIENFVKLVQSDTNMAEVTKKAFKGIDLDELESKWKAWVLAQKLPVEQEIEEALAEAAAEGEGAEPPAPAGASPGTGK
jgi:hypothetical protein